MKKIMNKNKKSKMIKKFSKRKSQQLTHKKFKHNKINKNQQMKVQLKILVENLLKRTSKLDDSDFLFSII